jgi:transposase
MRAAHGRRGELATVVSHIDHSRTIEMLDGFSRQIIGQLRGLAGHFQRSIDVVSLDAYRLTRHVIHARLPDARIVVDGFHWVSILTGPWQGDERTRRTSPRAQLSQ